MRQQKIVEFWYRHYWWISGIGSVILCGIFSHPVFGPAFLSQAHLSVCGGIAAAYFALIFFVQKQKLEQDRFVKNLFVLFNQRYDDLRQPLEEILQSGAVPIHHNVSLQRYFNLCAEEYYFWQAGRIPAIVWASWRDGMSFYLRSSQIHAYALREITDHSYYGLAAELKLLQKDICVEK